MKLKLRYIGRFQENKEHEIDEFKVDELLKTGDWEYDTKGKVPKVSMNFVNSIFDKEFPTMGWTEKEIKRWLEDNDIPIKYSITNDEKEDKLEEIKKYFE